MLKERKAYERISRLENAIRSDRQVIKELGTAMERDKEIKDTMYSEKVMEREVEAALEEMDILNMDFRSECKDGKVMFEGAIRILRDQVGQDKLELEWIMKRTPVSIQGKGMSAKKHKKE